MKRRVLRALLIVAVAAVAVAGPFAFAHAVRADQAEQQQEEKTGKEAAEQVAKSAKFSKDKALTDRVERIGASIAAIADTTVVPAGFGSSTVYPFKYSYHVIDEKEVNAFSLPGGHIYVYKGLLDLLTTDDEIAGVLAHETAHAAHHHVSALEHQENKMTAQMALAALAAVIAHVPTRDIGNLAMGAQYAQQAQLNNHYSENAEEDADHTGMIYMQKAGYNPVGMLALLQRLKEVEDRSPDVELGFLQDHPLTSQRLASARSELAQLGVPVDEHNLRVTSGTMIANVIDQDKPGAASVLRIGNNVICQVAADDKPKAVEAASKLNALLDQNLQLYEVRSDGAALIARDQPVITFTDADAKAQSVTAAQSASSTPEELAQQAARTIRNLLWNQTVAGTTEQQIDVAPIVQTGQ